MGRRSGKGIGAGAGCVAVGVLYVQIQQQRPHWAHVQIINPFVLLLLVTWLRRKPEADPSRRGYQMWCIGDVEAGFLIEGGREEVLAGRRGISGARVPRFGPLRTNISLGGFLRMGRLGLCLSTETVP